MQIRAFPLIVALFASSVTVHAAPPKAKYTPRPKIVKKGPALVLEPPTLANRTRGKYLEATPGAHPLQWIVRFSPQDRSLRLDATKSLLIGFEPNTGASVSPDTVFRKEWLAARQAVVVSYQASQGKIPSSLRVNAVLTICTATQKCVKELDDFTFDPSRPPSKAPAEAHPSVSKTPAGPSKTVKTGRGKKSGGDGTQ